MPLANLLAMAVGLVIAATGAMGIAAPAILLELGRSLQSAGALYVVAAVRIAIGVILVWAAPDSRTPMILRILGVLIILAGLATPFFGVDRSQAVVGWWSSQGSFLTRAWPGVAVFLGLFIAYSAMPKASGM